MFGMNIRGRRLRKRRLAGQRSSSRRASSRYSVLPINAMHDADDGDSYDYINDDNNVFYDSSPAVIEESVHMSPKIVKDTQESGLCK